MPRAHSEAATSLPEARSPPSRAEVGRAGTGSRGGLGQAPLRGSMPGTCLQGLTHPQVLIYRVSYSGSFAPYKGCRNLIAL
jgi:hypothetical protein